MQPKVTKKYLGLLIQNPRQKVLEVLFLYPEKEFSLTDISKESGVAKPHIGEILKELEALRFIMITKLTKIWRIKANHQNWNFIKSKILYNLNFLYQSGAVEFLNGYFGNPKAILIFRETYESIRELGDAWWWVPGYEPRTHEVSMEVLRDANIQEKVRLNHLSRFKKIRNDVNYRRFKVAVSQAREIMEFWDACAKEIITLVCNVGVI